MDHTFHSDTLHEVLSRLETDQEQGLSLQEGEKRLAEHGENRLEEAKQAGMLRRVLGQLKDPMILVLLAAARTLGGRGRWILLKHLIPNTMGPIIIELTFSIPNAIFTEATLSYLGLGVPVPLSSWGTLANEGSRMLLLYPYQLLFPALLISITMLGFNLLGDGLRDALDPKMRN